MNIRLPEVNEAEQFADWATSNSDIPSADIREVASAKASTTIVIEENGIPVMYMPLLPAVTIPYLGFRPGIDERTKAKALKKMKEALQNLQKSMGISDAYVFTQAEYPLGKWALRKGFIEKKNKGFTLKVSS